MNIKDIGSRVRANVLVIGSIISEVGLTITSLSGHEHGFFPLHEHDHVITFFVSACILIHEGSL